jgi:hypothetical protein
MTINLTEFEKTIYNCYLKNYRKDQPYRPRKDFSDVHPNIAAYLQRISRFLKKYNHIDCIEFFDAYNSIYPNDKYPPLNYFLTRPALKTYSLYKKQQEDRNPEKQLDKIKEGFKFIGLYCINNKIPLYRYLNFKAGYSYAWLNHYREHKINPYCLFELGDIFGILSEVPKDELYLFANNLYDNLLAFRDRYEKSKSTKDFVKSATTKVKFFVEKELTKN